MAKVVLSESVMRTKAWKRLRSGPRALYIEILRKHEEGRPVYLSQKEAGDELMVGTETVRGYFRRLVEVGLIIPTDQMSEVSGEKKTQGYHIARFLDGL